MVNVESRARASSRTRLDSIWGKDRLDTHRHGKPRVSVSSSTWSGIVSRAPMAASPGALGPEAIGAELGG